MAAARKKKKSVCKKILIAEIIVLIAVGLVALYVLVLNKTTAYEFIGRFLSPWKAAKALRTGVLSQTNLLL